MRAGTVARAAALAASTCVLALVAALVLAGSWAVWALGLGALMWLALVAALAVWPELPTPGPARLDVHVWHHGPVLDEAPPWATARQVDRSPMMIRPGYHPVIDAPGFDAPPRVLPPSAAGDRERTPRG